MLLVISGRHTHTQRKGRKAGLNPVLFCLICLVAIARWGGSRGQKRLNYEQSLIFLLSHGDREHVTLRVKGEKRWRKPE